ncbi:ATP-binding cassette domain-containing protein [Nocardia suismassiliense]|uniref:ATP-binding cassette domain-containing protein n=1 Tax=Nocardia suismassiliense TaxID=2077092 RepID=UPI001F19AD84|nr:ATP-binding cassette domain-containing protein [Nocardia suismassiliense]
MTSDDAAKQAEPTGESAVALRADGLVKRYGAVEALRGANFQVSAGEVVALIGDNGAGKSTLVKCLSGAEQPDSGRILLDGKQVVLNTPTAARKLGVETVYQDLAVAPDLDPAANLFLGRELVRKGLAGKLGMLDRTAMRAQAVEHFRRLGVTLQSADVPIGSLSGGQRQSVAVARAVMWASKVVFMDEPTAALGVVQRERVLDVIRRVRDEGIAVVLISHNMPEVLAVADRIEVLRLGRRVARFTAAEATLEQLVGAMTGALSQEGTA